MVDYHTSEKISHSGKRISPSTSVEGDILFPECDIFSRYNQSIYRKTIVITHFKNELI